MNNAEIDQILVRARHSFLGSAAYKGSAPIVGESDIYIRNGVEVVDLRRGETVLAAYALLDGKLVYAPGGVVEITIAEAPKG